jgi:signal transduction histidine kinase
VDVRDFVLRLRRRWVANGLPEYPLWIAALIDSAALVTAVVAVVQRRDAGNVWIAVALVAAAIAPWLIEQVWLGRTWPLFALGTSLATATLMTVQPLEYDIAPLFLVLATGHVTACVGVQRGLVSMSAGLGALTFLVVQGTMPVEAAAIYGAATIVAVDIGFVMRSQQLRIEAQSREHAVRERQAVLEERQRIAREVHDLVAHSLSVTMLHLTAARRDLEDGGDTSEAVESLREAERIGRQAVSDVRRTVGLLGSGGADEPPAPTVEDLVTLVAEFRAAGLDVELTSAGDLADVPPATGLGLYRIVQESLTNVAKHCAGSPARVHLDLSSDPGRLTIRNPWPTGASTSHGGSGLTGMAQRADLLGATLTSGRLGDEWVVQVELPRGDTAPDRSGFVCPLPRLVRGLPRATPA